MFKYEAKGIIFMKIMLITAPWEYGGEEINRLYPIGLSYLGAVLEEKGNKVIVMNMGDKNWDSVKDKLRSEIVKEKPDILGLSIMTSNRTSSFKLFKMAKELNKKIINVAGGVHSTILFEQMLKNYPQVDFIVRGEGEKTIIELLDAIEKRKGKGELQKIKGIAFKDGEKIVITEPRQRMSSAELNKLPLPKHEYFRYQIERYGVAYVMSSRGCPFDCKFCPSQPMWGRMVALRSAENVFGEIKYLIKEFPNLKLISFADDEFIIDNKRVIDLCKMIIDSELKIKWRCTGRVTSITDELVSWMKKAGCMEIGFGVESGSQKILDNMDKRQTIPQIIKAYDICRRNGMNATTLLITGFPGETAETINDTIKLLKRIRRIGDPGFLFLVPGTRVYEEVKKNGVINDDYWLTNKPIPFYFEENSKLKLTYWNLKIFFFSNLYADNGGLGLFFRQKILSKLNIPHLKAMLRRYTKASAKKN